MSTIGVDSVLSQIRALSAQVKPIAAPRTELVAGKSVEQSGFADLMTQTLNQVNQTQKASSDLATKFVRGEPGVELADVMLEMQKSSVSFRGVTEVRNRMVSAYQEIMGMQI
jgi:flagellar hook-basal body complex protein FliE